MPAVPSLLQVNFFLVKALQILILTFPGQTLAWDEFQTQSAGNSPFRQCGAGGVTPSVTVSLDDMFASGSGGSLPAFPTASTSAFQTLEKLLSALPQSQIVFNSPIKEVSKYQLVVCS